MIKQFTYLLVCLVFLSCKKENAGDCFKSTGSDKTEFRNVNRFDSIEIKSNMEVSIEKGNYYSVEITAGKHLLKNISASVKNGLLTLENNNTCNFVRGYKRKIKVHIVTPRVKKVSNLGVGVTTVDGGFNNDTLYLRAENSGDIHVNGNFDFLYASTHGNGDFHISGTAKNLLIYSFGTNFIKAENMQVSEHIYVSTTSVGDCSFNCNGLLMFDYYIYSDGNIYYTGNAQTTQKLGGEGTGQLIKKD